MSARTFIVNSGHESVAAGRRAVRWRPLLMLLALLYVGAAAAHAMPLAEYRSRIHQAVTELDAALKQWQTNSLEEHESVSRALTSAERAVPVEESVEWDAGSIRVNNSWLHEEVKKFRALSFSDPRVPGLVAGIWERLRAVEERLEEIESAKPTPGADAKAQDKARLEEILRRPEYVEKAPEESLLSRLWRRFVNWLNGLFPGRSGLQPGQMSWLSFIALILVFGLAGGLLGYALWKLTPLFRRGGAGLKQEGRGARVILGERLTPDQSAADLLREAEALARRGELRAAIRKGYVAILCELGDRKILTLGQHKTNRDYLRAVRDRRPLLDEMQKLTASFENHWYGSIPATPDDWATFRSRYQQALGTVTSDK